jgi:predicted hotdog family 3-hydroxylacyl-ACP dehydratase
MAQTAAVHAILCARQDAAGSAPHAMSLLGTRRLELSRGWLEPGESLAVEAAPAGASRSGLAVFDASVRDAEGREVARARLNLYAEGPGA